MTLNETQVGALIALADAIKNAALAFAGPAEAKAERLAIQHETPTPAPAPAPAPAPTPTPAPALTVEQLRDILNELSKVHGRAEVARFMAGRKLNELDESGRAALLVELGAAFQ